MAALTLNEAKLYLRVVGASDDALIASLMGSATIYLTGKTTKTRRYTGESEGEATYCDLADDDLFKQAVKMLVAHWYENRGVQGGSEITADIADSANAIMQHIENCGDYSCEE